LLEARHDICLLFTDVDMPGSLNGFALARIVDMRWPGIKVIVTSGHTRPSAGDLPKGMRFLPKPYAPSALIAMIQEMLSKATKPADDLLDVPAREQGSLPVLPSAIKVDQPHTGIGIAGGLAQVLPEAEE
jgi:DNA-binding NtrC family response regulator